MSNFLTTEQLRIPAYLDVSEVYRDIRPRYPEYTIIAIRRCVGIVPQFSSKVHITPGRLVLWRIFSVPTASSPRVLKLQQPTSVRGLNDSQDRIGMVDKYTNSVCFFFC